MVSGSSFNWRPATSAVPQESVVGHLLFNILINNPEKAMEFTLIKFLDDTKAAGQENRVESRAAIQWDLNILKSWTDVNLMIFYKDKYHQILHLGRKNPSH